MPYLALDPGHPNQVDLPRCLVSNFSLPELRSIGSCIIENYALAEHLYAITTLKPLPFANYTVEFGTGYYKATIIS